MSVWEGISLQEAITRHFGQHAAPKSCDFGRIHRPGVFELMQASSEAAAEAVVCDYRCHCAACGVTGRLGDSFAGVPSAAPLLVACSSCRVALYCSKACQRAAWKGGHKQECAGIGAVAALHCKNVQFLMAGGRP